MMKNSADKQIIFFFSSRRRHTRLQGDWSSDVCSSDLGPRQWLRFGSASARALWEKVPFAVLALIAAVVALRAQAHAGALRPLHGYGVPSRAAQAFIGLGFYLRKTLVPLSLSPLYEIPADLDLTGQWLIPA